MDHQKFVSNHIKDIEQLLNFEYGSPDHNNKQDPLDELIFILLSRRTRSKGYEKVFNELKNAFVTWEDVAKANPDDIYSIVNKAGLGKTRVEEIKDILDRVNSKFGEYSLSRMKKWGENLIFNFLVNLRGIGPKSAYCIMMYSFKKPVFPVDTHIKRICQRLGLIKEDVDHKEAQKLLADAFPKKLRYSLHVNMLAHGREICKTRNPNCDKCTISGYCKFPRMKTSECDSHNFIDLFAGAGGLSLGFEREGFNLSIAIESKYIASATFLYNRKNLQSDYILNDKIENIDPVKFKEFNIKVIIAGPPCQEFSWVRTNHNGDLGRKELYKEVLRFTAVLKPKFVVIENVPGMASQINYEYVDRIKSGLINSGYTVHFEQLNAKDYGIPQRRKRLFIIARRIDKSIQDAETSLGRVWETIRGLRSDNYVNFSQAISGLPIILANEGNDILVNNRPGRRSDYAIKMDCNGGLIFNHLARKHNPRDLEAYSVMAEGENAIDLYNKRADLMVYSTQNFHTKYFKIPHDTQSPTIVAHLRKDANSFIHPIANRGITVREAARLQSFPDTYRFLGTFGLQFEQIGNAVPPLLAEIIAKAVYSELEKDDF